MYHGDVVPGFPPHPHRGFETVTIARRGYIDHTDSLGAAARFGEGDVQWLTAGKGIVHAEMFPLLKREEPNPTELFQIWLNLPAKNKMAQPHFSMLWKADLPGQRVTNAQGKHADVVVVAGAFGEKQPLAPPPESWASQPEAEVAIWTLRLDEGANLDLPAAKGEDTQRTLYLFKGTAKVAGEAVKAPMALLVEAGVPLAVEALEGEVEMLVLQGRPIGEPVAQHGPFVMNTRAEILEAFEDYQRTQFGGWPWPSEHPVHPREAERFAKHPS